MYLAFNCHFPPCSALVVRWVTVKTGRPTVTVMVPMREEEMKEKSLTSPSFQYLGLTHQHPAVQVIYELEYSSVPTSRLVSI